MEVKKRRKLVRDRILLRKVKDVLEDEEQVQKIMKKYNKQAESKQEYKDNTKHGFYYF